MRQGFFVIQCAEHGDCITFGELRRDLTEEEYDNALAQLLEAVEIHGQYVH